MIEEIRHCDLCGLDVPKKSFGGHRSVHARAGEVFKRAKQKTGNVCPDCGKEFATGHKLGGHRKSHSVPFELLKKDGSRRERLIKELGKTCSVCKFSEWMGKEMPIELDHIDGNPENNDRTNLRLICPNCHAQTETYKGKNMGRVENSKRAALMKKYYGKYR